MPEVELKFQVPAHQRAAVDKAVAGRAQTRRVRLRASYWDTPERALAKAGLALRVRREGRVWVQTLKGAGHDGMTRLEHNVALPFSASFDPAADPALHTGTPAGERLLALLSQPPEAALQPHYRTDILRRVRRLKTPLGSVELAFDEGGIEAGERRLAVHELEIELLGGSPIAVLAEARRWVARFGLWLDTRSKAERGDLLSRGETVAPAGLGQPVQLKRKMTLRDARLAVLRCCADQVLVNASQVAAGTHSDEHVHQLRVGLRRLRCALALFRTDGPDKALADAAASMFRRLGTARDQAVLQGELRRDLEAALRSAGVEGNAPVPATAPDSESAQDVARSQPVQALLLDLLGATVEMARHDPLDPPGQDLPPQPFFRHRLNRWYRRAATDALRYAELDDAGRHSLRKQIKRLRYAVEFAGGLFEARAVRRFLKPVRVLQDKLGALNDVAMAMTAHRNTLATDPRSGFALGWLAARRDALMGQSNAELKAFAGAKRFWKKG
jgi:triphosphatase